MNLAETKALGLKNKLRKRVGRGPGSGHGKTSGRGHKGAKSRSLGYTKDADLAVWPVTLERVRERFADAVAVVPGHGPIGGLELLEATRRLIAAHGDGEGTK